MLKAARSPRQPSTAQSGTASRIGPSSPSSTLPMTSTRGFKEPMEIETAEPGIQENGTMAAMATGTGLKISVARDELVAKLGVVSRAVSTRGTVQVLSGILLSADGETLTLAATDMEVSLRTTLEAQVEGDGAVVIPGKPLVELARLLPESDVTIEYRPEEGTVQIVSGSYNSRLHVFNAEDFPRLPTIDAQLHSIDREALLETVDRVARSASRDESRPVLTGILVRLEAGKLVMVATDSYRLSVKETELGEAAPELEAIIPARALTELSRLAGGDTIELGVHENHVVFGTSTGDAADAWLTTRRIDGQFPNYRQLLPEAFEVELTLPAQTQDVGETQETMPAAYSGEEFVIGFNAEFLRDGVDSIVGDDVKVKLINPLRPAILEDAAGDFTYLIMPIRLAG